MEDQQRGAQAAQQPKKRVADVSAKDEDNDAPDEDILKEEQRASAQEMSNGVATEEALPVKAEQVILAKKLEEAAGVSPKEEVELNQEDDVSAEVADEALDAGDEEGSEEGEGDDEGEEGEGVGPARKLLKGSWARAFR